MSVTDYAASGNTSVGGINISTGCSPANVDNALRKIVDDIGEGLANGYFATALPVTKTAGYTVLTTDRGKLFNCTSALTLALPVAATAGAGFMFWVKANGAAVILDPNAAELIDGAATVTIASGSSAFVVCTGTAWVTAFVATSYDWAAAVVAASGKATPIDADSIGIVDSAASNVLKETTIGELRTVFLAGTPTLSTIEGLSLVAGDILYATAADTITRLPKGTALQYLQQNSALTAPQWVTGREVLTAARTYYVRPDGSNSNTGLINTSGGAFLTIQKAVDVVAGLDCSIYTPTIQVGAGTYTSGVALRSIVGSDVIIIGDETTPANVLISVTNTTCFFADGISGVWHLRGVKMQTTTAGNCITATNGAKIKIQNVAFGACAGFHMQAYGFANISLTGNYSITAGATVHLVTSTAFFSAYGRTITLTGTPAWGASMFDVSVLGAADLRTLTFSGAATGKRYNITSGGVIDTNGGGASFIPGSVAGTGGTTTGGGFYI